MLTFALFDRQEKNFHIRVNGKILENVRGHRIKVRYSLPFKNRTRMRLFNSLKFM